MTYNSKYIAPPWLRNKHLQTLWGPFLRREKKSNYTLQELELPDGDVIELLCADHNKGPVVLLLHGLGGSINSHYMNGLFHHLIEKGYHVFCMHMRGSGFKPNRMIDSYHMGKTKDLAFVVEHLKKQYPTKRLFAIGFSLGANVLLKWLGETGRANPLTAAIAVSTPFEPAICTKTLNIGFGKCYQNYLLKGLKEQLLRKQHLESFPFDIDKILKIRTLYHWDNFITAPLNGFKDAGDYYQQTGSRSYLRHIEKPTLILHAEDDPFMNPTVIPSKNELSDSIEFELSQNGGHVGFIGGSNPLAPEFWLERRIVDYLKAF